MFIVTKNNTYYPSVEYFGSIEEANTQRDEWLAEMASVHGEYDCEVTVAEVRETRVVRSDY